MGSLLTTLITPVVTMAAAWIVTLVKKDLPPWIVTTFLVPVISAVQTAIPGWQSPDLPWYISFALGMLGTFLFEFLKNIKNAKSTS